MSLGTYTACHLKPADGADALDLLEVVGFAGVKLFVAFLAGPGRLACSVCSWGALRPLLSVSPGSTGCRG